MSGDECTCCKCEPAWELVVEAGSVTFPLIEAGAIVMRQQACIDELLGLIGYLPQGLAVLEKHGLTRTI